MDWTSGLLGEGFGGLLSADVVVRGTLVLLLLASVCSWWCAIVKALGLWRASRASRRFSRGFSGGLLGEGAGEEKERKEKSAWGRVWASGFAERRRCEEAGALREELGERVHGALGSALTREALLAERGLGILATVGTSAPFVGLFGTVWGIMNAFRAVALSGEAHLSVVAPGVSEALFATAFGLFAAIPSVVFYNWLGGWARREGRRAEGFAQEVWGGLTGGYEGGKSAGVKKRKKPVEKK